VLIIYNFSKWHLSKSSRAAPTAPATRPSFFVVARVRPTIKHVAASFSKTRTSTTRRSTDSVSDAPTVESSPQSFTPPSKVIKPCAALILRSSEDSVSLPVSPTTPPPTPLVSCSLVASSLLRTWLPSTKASPRSTASYSPSGTTSRRTDVPSRLTLMSVSSAPPLVTVSSVL